MLSSLVIPNADDRADIKLLRHIANRMQFGESVEDEWVAIKQRHNVTEIDDGWPKIRLEVHIAPRDQLLARQVGVVSSLHADANLLTAPSRRDVLADGVVE